MDKMIEYFPYMPKVSIVIPAYNASNYLAEAIDSALNQTYPNTEILVINDGSHDEGKTRAVAERYGDKIRYFEKENGGSSSAINVGIANMKGEWFSWLSHDDLYYPDKISENIRLLNSLGLTEEELADQIVVSASENVDKNRNVIHTPPASSMERMRDMVASLKSNAPLIAEPAGFRFHGCAFLIHRTAFERVGGFNEDFRLINDSEMWFRLFAGGFRIHYIPKVLAQARIHNEQVSNTIGFSYHNAEQDQYWGGCFAWLTEHEPDNYELFYRFGRNAYLKTRNDNGDAAFRRAGQICPEKAGKLKIHRVLLKARATVWLLMKRVYLALFIGKG